MILKRRVKDMEYTTHHAGKRFADLRNMEFIAKNRCVIWIKFS